MWLCDIIVFVVQLIWRFAIHGSPPDEEVLVLENPSCFSWACSPLPLSWQLLFWCVCPSVGLASCFVETRSYNIVKASLLLTGQPRLILNCSLCPSACQVLGFQQSCCKCHRAQFLPGLFVVGCRMSFVFWSFICSLDCMFIYCLAGASLEPGPLCSSATCLF